jgi:hypothetical protein
LAAEESLSAGKVSSEQRDKYLAEYDRRKRKDPNLSLTGFAEEKGIKPGTFRSWQSRASKEEEATATSQGSRGPAGRMLDVDLADTPKGRASLVRFAVGSLMKKGIDLEGLARSMNVDQRNLRALLWKEEQKKSRRAGAAGEELLFNIELTRLVQRTVHTTTVPEVRGEPPPFGDPPPYPLELHEELLGVADEHPARIPSSWFKDLASSPPVRTTEVYATGEALYSTISAIKTAEKLRETLRLYEGKVEESIGYLFDVAVQPPRVGTRAIHLLSRFGIVALDPREYSGTTFIKNILYNSPLGYRAMRVIGRMISLQGRAGHESALHHGLLPRIDDLLQQILKGPAPQELYPERSLLVESLWKITSLPADGDGRRYALDALEARALGIPTPEPEEAPRSFRERAFAAIALQERDPVRGREVQARLERQLRKLHEEEKASFTYLLDTLRAGGVVPEGVLITTSIGKLIDLEVERPRARVPAASKPGAKALLRCAFLGLHGTRRRRAIETLRHSGFGPLTVRIGAAIAQDEEQPSWVRALACFAMGFQQEHSAVTPLGAIATVADTPSPVRVAALHGLGDIGIRDAGEGPDVISRLALVNTGRWDAPERRALAYALSTYRPQRATDHLVSSSTAAPLTRITDQDEDELARRMADWGLERLRRRSIEVIEPRVPNALGRYGRTPARR